MAQSFNLKHICPLLDFNKILNKKYIKWLFIVIVDPTVKPDLEHLDYN